MNTLRDYQKKPVELGVSFFSGGYKKPEIIVMPTGCHPKGFEVFKIDGTTEKVENIKVGDKLIGPDSAERNVLQLIRGNGKIYKIETTKGDELLVNEDHILYLVRTNLYNNLNSSNRIAKNNYYKLIEEVSVKDYLLWSKSKKHLYKLKKSDIINFLNKKVDIPYFLGLWLGDGNKNSITITNQDIEITNFLKNFCKDHNLRLKINGLKHAITTPLNNGKKLGKNSYKINICLKTFRDYNFFKKGKRIPTDYLCSDKESRLQLLAGIIDSDGYYDIKKNRYEITFKSKLLAQDLWLLINSLGFSSKINQKKVKCNNCKYISDNYIAWRISFSGKNLDKIPCLISRKKAKIYNGKRDFTKYGFSISYIGEDNYYGFILDKDNLYLDKNFIIHHNSGKSHVIAETVKQTNQPAIILQPSKELLQQNFNKYKAIDGEATIYSASLKKKEISNTIFATIGSIIKAAQEVKRLKIKNLYIDECHLYPRGLNGQLRTFIQNSGIKNILGYTATAFKLQSNVSFSGIPFSQLKMLTSRSKKGKLFNNILHVTQIQELIEKDYWSKLIYNTIPWQSEGLKINSTGADFIESSIQDNYERMSIRENIIEQLVKNPDRKKVIVFVHSIEEAMLLASKVPNSAAIYSGMKDKEREKIIENFKNDELRVIFNVSILGTGFDSPNIDMIIVARPMLSLALFYQFLGRGVRILNGKLNCLVIDMCGNLKRFGKIEELVYKKETDWQLYNIHGKQLTNLPLD